MALADTFRDRHPPPLVSVVMPTYQHAAYIRDAIESVLSQTFIDFELVIIDNFSEDETEDIVRSYFDSRIRYLKFKNQGIIAASRNYGIRHSSGEYIAFLDSDDIWHREKLEKQVELMEQRKDIGLCYVLYSCLYPNGKTRGGYPVAAKRFRGFIFNQLYLFNAIPNSGAMIRRSVLAEIGTLTEDPRFVAVEDADLWLRIVRRKAADYVDQELLTYRIGKKRFRFEYLVRKLRGRLHIARKHAGCAGYRLFLLKVALTPLGDGVERMLLPDRLLLR